MQLNDSEWKVMSALWRRRRAGLAELHAELEPETGWAYSTVKTLLRRMLDKGAVTAEPRPGGRVYRPALGQEEARSSAFRAFLDRAFGGAVGSFAQHLVDGASLSRREKADLAAALAELSTDEAETGPPTGQRRDGRAGERPDAGGEDG